MELPNNGGQQMNNQLQSSQKNQSRNANEAALGLDMDEQEMNGLYGMVETATEDQIEPNTERDGR
ncbi:DUF4021 domain-containing protein [Niallia oryzisoli]|uniref:DUF4021 domain-containing protein n=1 Tax=Niallia oryzisoli TaxID=1737571 RepID=UPI003736EC67